jgi:hypothetical protein
MRAGGRLTNRAAPAAWRRTQRDSLRRIDYCMVCRCTRSGGAPSRERICGYVPSRKPTFQPTSSLLAPCACAQ